MRIARRIAGQRGGEVVDQFVERRSAVACDTFEHFDAALSATKNGSVRPAERVFE